MENGLIWLSQADGQIAATEQRVIDQRKRIKELELKGADPGEATKLLCRMLEILSNYREHRQLIIRQLARSKLADLRDLSADSAAVTESSARRALSAPAIHPSTIASQILEEIGRTRARRRARAFEELVEAALKYRAACARGDPAQAPRPSQGEEALRQKVVLAYEAMRPKARISAAEVRIAEWAIKMRKLRAADDPTAAVEKAPVDVDNVVRPGVWHRPASPSK